MQETSVRFLDPEVSRRSFRLPTVYSWASLVAQMVKTLPAVWETWVQSLGWKDTLEEGMGLCRRMWAFSTCAERNYSFREEVLFVVGTWLFIVMASFVAEHRL